MKLVNHSHGFRKGADNKWYEFEEKRFVFERPVTTSYHEYGFEKKDDKWYESKKDSFIIDQIMKGSGNGVSTNNTLVNGEDHDMIDESMQDCTSSSNVGDSSTCQPMTNTPVVNEEDSDKTIAQKLDDAVTAELMKNQTIIAGFMQNEKIKSNTVLMAKLQSIQNVTRSIVGEPSTSGSVDKAGNATEMSQFLKDIQDEIINVKARAKECGLSRIKALQDPVSPNDCSDEEEDGCSDEEEYGSIYTSSSSSSDEEDDANQAGEKQCDRCEAREMDEFLFKSKNGVDRICIVCRRHELCSCKKGCSRCSKKENSPSCRH